MNTSQDLRVPRWVLPGLAVVVVVVALISPFGWYGTLLTLLMIGLLAAAGWGAVRLYLAGIHVVPADMVGVVHRRYGRVRQGDVHLVRIHGSPGTQAKILPTGAVRWLMPYLYQVETVPMIYIRPEYVGLVFAKVGGNLSTNVLARYVECGHFQDGAAFLAGGGEQGPQPGLLAGGGYYNINPYMFTVEEIPRVHVSAGKVGLVTAKVGRRLPVKRPVADHVDCDFFQDAIGFLSGGGQQGPQPMLLTGGGYYDINPYVFSVQEIEQTHIELENVGVVTAKVGHNLPANRQVARPVECDYFQDGPAFLAGGGEQGPQPGLLAGGGYYNINPHMFTVQEIPQAYIRPNRIGVVVARVGANLPHGRPFGGHVECDHFQDGPAFLRAGGQQGPQLALLTGGNRYSINPHMFEVITEDNVDDKLLDLTVDDLKLVSLLEGNTGVVVIREGAPAPEGLELAPYVEGHDRFQLPWVFLERGGRQGTQAETLPGGADYAINPLFARVVWIPTRELILEWDDMDGKAEGDRYDSALEPIKATIEGHAVRVQLTQTLRIPSKAAPMLVKRFGEQETEKADLFGFVKGRPAPVKRFVERILGSVVSGYFSRVSAQYKITDFMDKQHEVQADLQHSIQMSLQEWDVIATNTTLGQITFDDDTFNRKWKELVATRVEYSLLEQAERNNKVQQRIEMDKLKTYERRKAIDAGTEAQTLINLLGKDHVLKERFMNLLTQLDVPQVVAGGADAAALAQYVSPAVLFDVINQAMNGPHGTVVTGRVDDAPPPAHPDRTQIDDGSTTRPDR